MGADRASSFGWAALIGLLAGSVGCLPKDGGGPGPHQSAQATIRCTPDAALATLRGLEIRSTLTCTVDGETPESRLTNIEASARPPFTAAVRPVSGRVAGASFVVEVGYLPSSDGAHAGEIRLRFRRGGAADEARVAVHGDAGRRGRWPALPAPPTCSAPTRSLIDEALDAEGLAVADLAIDDAELAEASAHEDGLLDDGMALPMLAELRRAPHRAGCVEGRLAGAIDALLSTPHPVAASIRHASRQLNASSDAGGPIGRSPGGFDEAITALCSIRRNQACGEASGSLPDDLRGALAPILWSMVEGLAARFSRDDTLDGSAHDPTWWQVRGGFGLLFEIAEDRYNASYALDRAYLDGDRSALYEAAASLAHAIESTTWATFAGRQAVHYDLQTPAGWIRVRGGEATTYPADDQATLLLLDLGGDDVYSDVVASNESASNAVSLLIDLGGDDVYAIDTAAEPRHAGDDERGAVSLSERFSQGAARNGIAMLFDLGGGDDRYTSLRGSQGYAHQGVGVLFDDGGSDRYTSEAASQGAAQFGIAIAMDLGGGDDERRSFTTSQGFGFTAGAGLLVDDGGRDLYLCDTGDPASDGTALYPAAQVPGTSNTSLCQGAGFGFRSDVADLALSGGIGLLRDLGGDDRYIASVYAQGVGYWQSVGVLSDGGGDDTYDAHYYAQGAGVHFANGILVDEGDGADVFGEGLLAHGLTLGAGHDFGVGVLISEGGDDRYRIPNFGGGAASCNGVGLFADNGGDDVYAGTTHSTGVSNVGACVGDRPNADSIGVMIDAAGADTYRYPRSEHRVPADDARWGHGFGAASGEYGVGLDGTGDTGLHPQR